jgi:urease accessory protein
MEAVMLRVERRVVSGAPTDVLSLPYDERKKSRLRARSEAGHEVAIVLERGSSLRHGDLLAADSGEILLVRAAAESVSDVTSADAVSLAKAAYHLGNRHVPLQIERGALRYQRDHVLDAMVLALGLQVTQRTAAFEPESGAYSGHSHSHGDEHEHGQKEHVQSQAREDDTRRHAHEAQGHAHGDHQRQHEPGAYAHGDDAHRLGEQAHAHGDDAQRRGHGAHSHGDGAHPHEHGAHSHGDDVQRHGEQAHSHGDDAQRRVERVHSLADGRAR